jgi:glutathione S-transferase
MGSEEVVMTDEELAKWFRARGDLQPADAIERLIKRAERSEMLRVAMSEQLSMAIDAREKDKGEQRQLARERDSAVARAEKAEREVERLSKLLAKDCTP